MTDVMPDLGVDLDAVTDDAPRCAWTGNCQSQAVMNPVFEHPCDCTTQHALCLVHKDLAMTTQDTQRAVDPFWSGWSCDEHFLGLVVGWKPL